MINVKGEVEISDKQTVAVVGLGKIGLPLAVMYANHGFNVIGADINPDVVAKVNQGKSHLLNEPGVPELLERAHKQKTIVATTRTKEAVKKASIVVVIVPVIVDDQNNVNFSYIDAAVEEIGKGLQKGTVVIFETTLPTGTTRNRFGTKLEEVSNLVMGTDFYLAYSPERVYSNRILQDLKSYPKVVGGINEVSLQKAVNFYQQSLQCDILEVTNTETAEFSKVAESVYRDVNIALSNELAVFADSLDVNISDVIKAGNSQPFCHLHHPGVGVGGHCIPIYPYFFMNFGLPHGVVSTARLRNDLMAEYAICLIEEEVVNLANQNVLILGMAYRENVKETTKSSALLLIELLQKKGANVFVCDPLYTDEELKAYGAEPLSISDKRLAEMDAVILQAYHDEFHPLPVQSFTACQVLMDGRNALDKHVVESHGIRYRGIGQ